MSRRTVTSGAEWEAVYGYRRAVRLGDVIAVAGTTAPGPDAYVQASAAFRIAQNANPKIRAGLTRRAVTDLAAARQSSRDQLSRRCWAASPIDGAML